MTSYFLMRPLEETGEWGWETASIRWVTPSEARELIRSSRKAKRDLLSWRLRWTLISGSAAQAIGPLSERRLKVRIHRGAHEIGGSCVEVEAASGERIVLDVGAPLTTIEGEDPALPDVAGFVEPDYALKAIVITHAHQDHWGLVDRTLPAVPLCLGQAAHQILKEAAF